MHKEKYCARTNSAGNRIMHKPETQCAEHNYAQTFKRAEEFKCAASHTTRNI